ncbi:hypothetical protein BWQ96_06990 [Gracilariopsis chorda]|uniref:Uncharacterized protein n=1 Tax=Gracilariopsis chorda TaxID=448386 RepID=A0A2V3IMF4_9FLOR|nr:hypothetical protein BWQ96_06990 [Gracilariopsis chorda]|eukprot:PXF43263.1 hypothetical protein BWQ96_06990 [Gracilariopsis chorda]
MNGHDCLSAIIALTFDEFQTLVTTNASKPLLMMKEREQHDSTLLDFDSTEDLKDLVLKFMQLKLYAAENASGSLTNLQPVLHDPPPPASLIQATLQAAHPASNPLDNIPSPETFFPIQLRVQKEHRKSSVSRSVGSPSLMNKAKTHKTGL